jgi:cobaltochelatase CobS
MMTETITAAQGSYVAPRNQTDIAEDLGIAAPTSNQKLLSKIIGKPVLGLDLPITFFQDTDWSEEMQCMIPSNTDDWYKGFNPDAEVLRHILVALERNMKLMVHGPSGSGKTATIKYACALTRRPYIRIGMTGDTLTDSMLGARSVSGSEVIWQDGLVTTGVREGAVVAIDEWEVTPPEIMFALQEVLEKGGNLTLRDYPSDKSEDKIIVPHDEFRLMFCGNTIGQGDSTGAFAGVTVQNSATINRFQIIVHQKHADVGQYVTTLNQWTPNFNDLYGTPNIDKKIATLLRDVQHAYRGNGTKSLSVDAGFRTLETIHDLMQAYGTPAEAIRMAIYEKCDGESKKVLADMYQQLFGTALIAA